MKHKPSPRDLGLSSDSFVSGFNTDIPTRVIANIEGGQKSGKDHFSIETAPGPITIFNFDQGLEGVIEKFIRNGKHIIVAGDPRLKTGSKYPSYHFAKPVPASGENRKSKGYLERMKQKATPVWERFISDLDEFYHSDCRTGVIDTGGAAYSLAKLAFHGMDKGKPAATDDPYGQKSGDMKSIFQGLILNGYDYDKNVLWLHRIKEQWKNNQPSGVMVADGFNQVAYECQLTIRLKRSLTGEFSATVMDCRLDIGMNGETFDGKQCKFSKVMAAVTGSDEENWE